MQPWRQMHASLQPQRCVTPCRLTCAQKKCDKNVRLFFGFCCERKQCFTHIFRPQTPMWLPWRTSVNDFFCSFSCHCTCLETILAHAFVSPAVQPFLLILEILGVASSRRHVSKHHVIPRRCVAETTGCRCCALPLCLQLSHRLGSHARGNVNEAWCCCAVGCRKTFFAPNIQACVVCGMLQGAPPCNW